MAILPKKSSVRRFGPRSRKLFPGNCKSSSCSVPASKASRSFLGFPELRRHAPRAVIWAQMKRNWFGLRNWDRTSPNGHLLIKLQELGQNEKKEGVSPDRQKPRCASKKLGSSEPNVLSFLASSSRVHGFDFGCRGLSICETRKP